MIFLELFKLNNPIFIRDMSSGHPIVVVVDRQLEIGTAAYLLCLQHTQLHSVKRLRIEGRYSEDNLTWQITVFCNHLGLA